MTHGVRARARGHTAVVAFLLAGALLGSALAGVLFRAVAEDWKDRRIAGNEPATRRFLSRLAEVEAAFRDGRFVDADGDGRGEFGWVQDLPREPGSHLEQQGGLVVLEGYYVLVYLPGETRAVPESSPPPEAKAGSASDGRESHWVAYAWPVEDGSTGERAFVVSEVGQVLVTPNDEDPYEGRLEHVPGASAAFDSTGPEPANLGSGLAWFTGGPAVDERIWSPSRD